MGRTVEVAAASAEQKEPGWPLSGGSCRELRQEDWARCGRVPQGEQVELRRRGL